MRIRIRPAAQAGELRVGFYEEEVGGTGPQWHASGWMAVVLASMLDRVDPADYEFSFGVGGRIDGPSAGALMTVGVLAALQGDKVREDAAMTGIINPDSTVGPVGGIVHKIEGAAKAGKKLVLIPVGQRYSYDYNKGEMVDVVDVGKKLGVEVREVSNIFEAYELLTGSPLPRPQVSTASPQFPPKAFDRMRAKAREWLSRYQEEHSKFNALPAAYQQLLADYVAEAEQSASDAEDALTQGMAAVAYHRAWNAASGMEMVNLMANVLDRYLNRGLEDVVDYLKSTMAVRSEREAVVSLLQAEDVRTVSDVIALFDAYSEIGIAEGLILIADGIVTDLVKNVGAYTQEQVLARLMLASAYYTLAGDYVQLARDATDVAMGFGVAPAPETERVMRVAETMRRAAEANIALFESLIVDNIAQNLGIHPDEAKILLMDNDSYYLMAHASNTCIRVLQQEIGTGPESAPMVFGHSQSTYALSSMLLAKYYSLDAQVDEEGNVVELGREKALAEMLDFADRRARELINLCGEDVPIMAIFYYENARISRQGDADDQLSALGYYWQASILAQVAAYMSGK